VKTKESTETLTLRVPTSVKLQIEMAAHKDGRTINSWVNKTLKEYFESEKEKGSK
jgi:predicted HicB family RNase H-like nuclease